MTKNNFFILGILVFAAVCIFGLRHVLSRINQPVVATMKIDQASKNQPVNQIDLTPVNEKGNYATFNYPKGLRFKPTSAVTPYVEEFYFTARDIETWILAIDVVPLKGGNLMSDSDFMLRLNNPALFTENRQTVNGAVVYIMSDKSAAGFSKVAFLPHGSLIASVSLQGDDATGTQPLMTAFKTILNSWHWLK
jgi:hypothetical protein